MMQVQCSDGAMMVVCVCFAFMLFVSPASKQSWPLQKVNEADRMPECPMAHYTNSVKTFVKYRAKIKVRSCSQVGAVWRLPLFPNTEVCGADNQLHSFPL